MSSAKKRHGLKAMEAVQEKISSTQDEMLARIRAARRLFKTYVSEADTNPGIRLATVRGERR